MLLNKKDFFPLFVVYGVCFFSLIVPDVSFFGGGAVKPFWISVSIIFFSFFINIKYYLSSIDNVVFVLFLLIVLFFPIIFLCDWHEIISTNGARFPAEWFDMYHSVIVGNNFYKEKLQSVFQLINLFFFMMCYIVGNSIAINCNNRLIDDHIRLCIFSVAIINLLIMFYQKVIFGEIRPSGTLWNPQTVGVFSCIVLTLVLSAKKKLTIRNICFSVVALCLLVLADARSGLFTVVVMFFVFFVKSYIRLYVLNFILLVNITISVILPNHFNSDVFLFGLNDITSSYTLKMRFMMWSAFINNWFESPFFGDYGIIVYFTENIIWFFIQPYGVPGLLFLLVFLVKAFKLAVISDEVYLLMVSLLLIGTTYYGFFVGAFGCFWFFIVGFYFSSFHQDDI